ncbi:hypothetical protein RB195_008602 [Necator americanus]|uniref:Uncharacterized protein n=1 Tax=Necator americanus TaxID=51031 RepID=A0ABR1CRA6_NECAM
MTSSQNNNKKRQPYSFAWFRHGCCVPTTSVVWMIVVLFIFAMITVVFCCLAMFVVRWMYKRRIRKKSESLRTRYTKEDNVRRELEMRLKEIALRPIQTRHFHPCGDPGHGPPVADAQRPSSSEGYAENVPPKQVPRSDAREIQAGGSVPEFTTDDLRKRGLFTGSTPLTSTQQALVPDSSGHGSTTGQSSSEKLGTYPKCVKDHVETSTTHPTISTSTATTTKGSSTLVEEVQIDPFDVATTVHTVAKNYRGRMDRSPTPPTPGFVLVSRKPKNNEKECTSDILVPPGTASRTSTMTTTTKTTSTGVTSTTTGTTLPSSTTKKRSASETETTPWALRECDTGKKRWKSPQTGDAVKVIEITPSQAPTCSTSYFPYWTAQKTVSTSVEPNVSPSGRARGTKVATSETSSWMPYGTSRQISSQFTSTTSPRDTTRCSSRPEFSPRPRDVYELRRELDRLRTNEISRGMKELLEEAHKYPWESSKPPSLQVSSDPVRSSPRHDEAVSTPVPAEPASTYPSTFAALRAAFQRSGGTSIESQSGIGGNN